MKKPVTAPLLLILLLLTLVGCNVIPEGDYTLPYTPIVDSSCRSVLLEEYTGIRCVNCPAAAAQARLLEQTYGDRLITVSIHAGGFASPAGIFTQDLRTEAGSAYFSHFGFIGTPMGSVNRTPYRSSTGLNPSLWGAAIDEQLTAAREVKMEIAVDFDHQKREFILRCDVERIEGTADLALNLWLVEDSIFTPQITPTGVDQHYAQRHVMRGALNGTWGETLEFSADNQYHTTHTYPLPADVDPIHCCVVAFVGERSSLRILSVTTTPIVTTAP